MTGTATFFYAAFGGVAAEIAVIFALRHKLPGEAPHFLRSPLYYAVALAMAAAGGVVALAYAGSGMILSPILSIHIGASSPLLLRKLSETVVEPPTVPPTARVD